MTEFERLTRDFAEAESEWFDALLNEIKVGTETDAELRRLLAETRIDAEIRSRYLQAKEELLIATAVMKEREVAAYEQFGRGVRVVYQLDEETSRP